MGDPLYLQSPLPFPQLPHHVCYIDLKNGIDSHHRPSFFYAFIFAHLSALVALSQSETKYVNNNVCFPCIQKGKKITPTPDRSDFVIKECHRSVKPSCVCVQHTLGDFLPAHALSPHWRAVTNNPEIVRGVTDSTLLRHPASLSPSYSIF